MIKHVIPMSEKIIIGSTLKSGPGSSSIATDGHAHANQRMWAFTRACGHTVDGIDGCVKRQEMRQTDLLKRENNTFQPAGRQLQRKCDCGQHSVGGGECAECARQRQKLQRSPQSMGPAASREAPPIVHAALRSHGQPLDSNIRALMESRLGHDFSHVRVHTDERAAESARAVNALAYTVGRDIVIPSPYFQPGSSAGIRLLAHELTHVAQQDGNSTGTPSTLEVSNPDEGAEREADDIAASVHGQQTNHTATEGRVRLARQPAGSNPTPAAPTPQELMDEADGIRLSLLSRAIFKAHQVEIACDENADPQLMVEALPQEVRPFVSWLGILPTDSSFCPLVKWAKALMVENRNLTAPPFFFAGAEDSICSLGNNFAFARFEDTQIRICPKTLDPAQANSTARALILTHELFHDDRFQMGHPTLEVMNSSHCGSMGSFEAITNPYCMTNVIGQLGGGDRCVM